MCDACRGGGAPINYVRLRQDPPESYRLGPRDVLGVYIEGVLGMRGEAVPVHFTQEDNQPPAVGYPVPIREDGTISLPLIPPFRVAGMTIREAEAELCNQYCSRNILRQDQQRTMLTLMRPRTYQVLVIREDQGIPFRNQTNLDNLLLTTNKRGVTFAVDLPAYENDVLHALSETGGLPGNDAKNEVLVLRGGFDPDQHQQMKYENSPMLVNPVSGEEMVPGVPSDVVFLDQAEQTAIKPAVCNDYQNEYGYAGDRKIIRIPLRDGCGVSLAAITPDDVLLRTGDVVVVQSRESEVFYTGGLLPGGQHMLPRDYEIDVLQAIAMAGGSVNGVAKGSGQVGLGTLSIFPATRATVIRTIHGQQQSIAVNLKRALCDQQERVTIKPGDFILLEFTPREMIANVLFSTFRFSYFLNGID